MSIYIKGIEMPTVNKILMITGGGDIWEIVDPLNESHDQYLDGAKAIPVPDHGRLGDLDEFYADVNESALLTDGFKETFNLWFAEQETIIPADKEAGT